MIDERLIEQITDEIYRRLKGPRSERDFVCGDCTGTCATRCAFKVPDFVAVGVDRLGGTLGMGRVPADVASLIDHTLLKPDATRDQVATDANRVAPVEGDFVELEHAVDVLVGDDLLGIVEVLKE